MKKKIKDWFLSFILALLILVVMYAGSIAIACVPEIRIGFENFFGGKVNYSGSLSELLKDLSYHCIVALPITTIIIRFFMGVYENEKED